MTAAAVAAVPQRNTAPWRWLRRKMAIHLAEVRRHFDGCWQLSLSADASTYGGESTLVAKVALHRCVPRRRSSVHVWPPTVSVSSPVFWCCLPGAACAERDCCHASRSTAGSAASRRVRP